MSCVQCGGPSKYKCPTCRQPYCSVPCCKQHKLTPCSLPPELNAEMLNAEDRLDTRLTYDFPTEDTVAPDKLQLLEQSAKLRQCLENPHVRKILQLLDKSPHPDELMQEYMLEPIFTEFVDACLKVVQPLEEFKNG